MNNERWEVGSFFPWFEDLIGQRQSAAWLPKDYVLFSNGRGTLLSLARQLDHGSGRRTLHLPSYFDMETTAILSPVYDVKWYRDLPTDSSPDFGTLQPAPGDVVLALNVFGIRDGRYWADWVQHHDSVTLIEDHTHDPLSAWAQQSRAHFAFASLRKTLPIPDGGILWSPRGLPVPTPAAPPPAAAYERLAAMVLRGAYLRGAPISRDVARGLAGTSESGLDAEYSSSASGFTTAVLGCLDAAERRRRREANVRRFLQLTTPIAGASWQVLFSDWPEGAVPLGGVLRCENPSVRADLRQFLAGRNIFCPVHWPQPLAGVASDDPAAISLSERLLTIPIDDRLSADDVVRVVSTIAEFVPHMAFARGAPDTA